MTTEKPFPIEIGDMVIFYPPRGGDRYGIVCKILEWEDLSFSPEIKGNFILNFEVGWASAHKAKCGIGKDTQHFWRFYRQGKEICLKNLLWP